MIIVIRGELKKVRRVKHPVKKKKKCINTFWKSQECVSLKTNPFIYSFRETMTIILGSVQDTRNNLIAFIFHVKNLFILSCGMDLSKSVTYTG